ncbi:thioesterase II family protein [Paraburkholderia kururiensis]|uniref:Alpha/beta fold hydrolase n=1 Tax=Paraburkholderia kururiensis TaxID=984307 RepID=A0ABZ0WKR3_9BURK|nr:alpha/beta fold hydrolase [Paraburkholderia kururiensis]WQD77944.1 alpha/beta fold hydrolase [Paraburkholderia kururiensis]
MRFTTQRAAATPRITLVCLAHAGGNAALYRTWSRQLPSFTDVMAIDLPGHGVKRNQPPLADWPSLMNRVADDVAGALDTQTPFAIFGHSMGALVGLELAHALRQRGFPDPVWLGASGTVAPARRAIETHWLASGSEVLVERLRVRGGTPAALLDDHEFIDFMLPALRADFHLCGVHPAYLAARVASGSEPLDCAIDVFIGRDDPATCHAADVEAWSDETRAGCTVHRFHGGHFFLTDDADAVLTRIADGLATALPRDVSAATQAAPSFVREPS